MIAWLKVIALGLTKLPIKVVAPVAYFFISDKNTHPVFGVRDATDLSWWNIGVRNAAHNMYNRPGVPHTTTGNTDDESLEKLEGIQWRYRKSLDGKYVSFRVTWGEPRPSKGKREFYVGWTMGQTDLSGEDRMRLTFFQFRAGWKLWTLIVAVATGIYFVV